jgi:hypothetical protein
MTHDSESALTGFGFLRKLRPMKKAPIARDRPAIAAPTAMPAICPVPSPAFEGAVLVSPVVDEVGKGEEVTPEGAGGSEVSGGGGIGEALDITEALSLIAKCGDQASRDDKALALSCEILMA